MGQGTSTAKPQTKKISKKVKGMDAYTTKMQAAGLSKDAIEAFKSNYEQLVAGVTGLVPETEIDAIEELPRHENLTDSADADKELLSKTAVLKLNGGLGTSMGLEKAKSLLEVTSGNTFLDLIAKQVKYMRQEFMSPNLRFVLMNSFSTSEDTMAFLKEKHPDLAAEEGLEMVQNKSPKVDAETMKPAVYAENPDMEWCPPGHGDIYPTLSGSGTLDKLLEAGIEYLFVSNSDNLGATLDMPLLRYFAAQKYAFMVEVAERTEGDKKGGHLCKRKSDGKFMLRESAMCPDDDKEAFEDITKHKFFNTNNLWIHLPQLKTTLAASGGVLKLPLIKNKKTVNPRDKSSPKVFQLETAMGSAIECFDNTGAVVVPRSRFAPVKTCNDLFVLRSDAFQVTPASTVELAASKAPLAKLDDDYYKLVDKMESLVLAAPSMKELVKLTVKGPVKFPKGVTLKGTVTITNSGDSPVELPASTYSDATLDVTSGAAVPA